MAKGIHRKLGVNTRSAQLGTFGGVFTPSVLTILGIILFLRLGYVVGNAGLAHALLIIGLANAISVLTSVSLAAIASNLKVKGGGDYYLISRTLGVEFGGAIGIVLFLAQSVSIAFYCIGFGEATAVMLPEGSRASPQLIAALAVSFLFVFAWLGADWATRFQYVVMTLLALALASFFAGGLVKWEFGVVLQNWSRPAEAPPFWVLFAIFFPAVTGFTQGVSMSGDLKDAGKSLPQGTFLAVGVSILVYFGVALVFAGALPGEILSGDYRGMWRAARVDILIDAGVIAATLSSGMASFLGAPRILQSLSSDRVIPVLLRFAKGYGAGNNPRRGVLLSAGIAFLTVALGNLNVIAPVVSMFFLISYGLLNYATFYEARSSSPFFRPRFRWYDYRLSLMGWIACLGIMLAIHITAGIIAISVMFAIYQYLKRTAGPARWADSRRSYHLKQVREHLLSAAAEPHHPRDWRPQVLAFSDDPSRRKPLLRFAYWIQGGSGITTAVQLLEGNGIQMTKRKEEAERELKAFIGEQHLPAFPLVVTSSKPGEAIPTMLQSFGVGPLRVNTVLLNWMEESSGGIAGIRALTYGRNLRMTFRLGCNIVILAGNEAAWQRMESLPSGERRIDVWWMGDATSNLMLLLAYLMTRNEAWEDANIRVLATGESGTSMNSGETLEKALEEARIEAIPEVVRETTAESVVAHSREAAMVYLPFRLRGNQVSSPFGGELDNMLRQLPTVALVLAAEDIDLDAEPEEGEAGVMAAATDAATEAEKRAREAEKDEEQAASHAEAARRRVDEITARTGPGADREAMEQVEAAIHEAEEAAREVERATRRKAKARAKAEEAAHRAAELGASVDKGEKKSEGTEGEGEANEEGS